MYRIKVIDTLDLIPPIPGPGTEFVAARSAILSHLGGDRLDNTIIGSTLAWVFVGLDCRDGKYSELFTGNENRFRVELEDENQNLIWQGFLLPDAYQEPYRNYVQDVSFTATDGLGRLKGKSLGNIPEDLSVVEVICRALRLTGLNLNLRFAPAIVNFEQKDFRQIWLDSDNLRQMDAYTILQELATSLGSSIYQADNYWYFEGWNLRNLPSFYISEYNQNGVLVGEGTVQKNIKDVQVLAGGVIDVVPPYGYIEASYTKGSPELDSDLTSMSEQLWADFEGAADNNEVYATAWVMDPAAPMLANKEDGVFFIPEVEDGTITPNGPTYNIRNKPFLQEGVFYRLTFSLRVEVSLVEPADWEEEETATINVNALHYQILLGGEPLIGDPNAIDSPIPGIVQVDYTFGREWAGEQYVNQQPDEPWTYEFRAPRSGLLDITIFNKMGVVVTSYDGIELDDLEFKVYIEDLAIEEVHDIEYMEVASRDITQDYTLASVTSLTFSGDASGQGGAFRLERVDGTSGFETFSGDTRRHFKIEDLWYYITPLKIAQLAHEFPNNVYDVLGDRVEIEDVEYNWLLSQEHAIISPDLFFGSVGSERVVRVQVPTPLVGNSARSNWDAWGVSFYQMQNNPFVQAHVDLLSMLFSAPLIRAATGLRENVKINDVIRFQYQGDKTLALTTTHWDLDQGHTDIVGTSSPYDETGVPPAVEIVEMTYRNPTTVQLAAEAVSPMGNIEDIEWEVLSGTGSFNSDSIINPQLTFNGIVKIRVTVTDDEGVEASDEVYLYEKVEVRVGPPNATRWLPQSGNYTEEIDITIQGDMPDSYVVNITGYITLRSQADVNGMAQFYEGDAMRFEVNGVSILEADLPIDEREVGPNGAVLWEVPFSINIRQDDDVTVVAVAGPDRPNNSLTAQLRMNRGMFVVGYGTILGAPSREDRPDPRPGTRPGGGGIPPRRG